MDHLANAMGTINFFPFERKDYIVTSVTQTVGPRGKPDFELYHRPVPGILQDQYNGVGIISANRAAHRAGVRQGYLQAPPPAILSAPRTRRPAITTSWAFAAFSTVQPGGLPRSFCCAGRRAQNTFIDHGLRQPAQRGSAAHADRLHHLLRSPPPSAAGNMLYIHKNTPYAHKQDFPDTGKIYGQ